MNINIKIEDYLSEEEIKEIVSDEIRKHVRQCVGDISVSSDIGRVFVGKLVKTLAKEGVQEIIPDFKELINQLLIQYDKEMNIINEFESVMDAFKSTNVSRTAITNNLSGLSKTAGGFIWKYKQLNN